MADLDFIATQSTPAVITDAGAGTLTLRGDSYPENSFQFFAPIIGWLEAFLRDSSLPLRIDLYLLYLNTSSVKAMMDIFDMLEDAHAAGRAVAVNWYYDAENERIAELAEEFKEDCHFPFGILLNQS